MNEKMTEWIEHKIGKLLSDDIDKRIDSDSYDFDVEKYSSEFYEEHFHEIENIQETDVTDLNLKLNLETDEFYLTDDSDSDDRYDYQLASLDSIIQDLQDSSEVKQIRGLESLESCSAEELVMHNSWTTARKILQDMLKTSESEKISSHILEVFRRFLLSNDTPKVVCEGFVSLGESITFHIAAINSRRRKERGIETYNFKTNKWKCNSSSDDVKEDVALNVRVIFKSMWLLVKSQKGIPVKWNRFNEKRLREIVFSFVHMLSSTRSLKNSNKICGLEILSVLDPRAVWVSNWCHGATGRTLLCSALKAHKKLFGEIVDFVLVRVKEGNNRTGGKSVGIKLPPLVASDGTDKTKGENRSEYLRHNKGPKLSSRSLAKENETSKGNHSAPPLKSDGNAKERGSAGWVVRDIPMEVVEEAKFSHCMSMVTYLIQYRGGRSLFPLEVTSRRRRMTITDFIGTVLNYINGLLFFSEQNFFVRDAYREHLLKLLHILKSI